MVISENFRILCLKRDGQMCMYEPRQRCKKRCTEGNCPDAPGETMGVKQKVNLKGRRSC